MASNPVCGAEYVRAGGRQPGDRTMRCDLPAGHDGGHEETDTGSTWPAAAERRHDPIVSASRNGVLIYRRKLGGRLLLPILREDGGGPRP